MPNVIVHIAQPDSVVQLVQALRRVSHTARSPKKQPLDRLEVALARCVLLESVMKTSTAPQLRPLGATPTIPVPATRPPTSQSFLAEGPSSSAPPASTSRPIVRSALAQALSSLPPAPPVPQQTLLAPVSTPSAPVVQKPRVVVADPDAAARARVVQMLRDICDVEEAVNGVQAATLCATGRVPVLLITDVTTPQIDGFTLVKLIKNHPTLKRVPVVFLSAKASPRDVAAAIGLGVRQFINKGSPEQEISSKLRNIVSV